MEFTDEQIMNFVTICQQQAADGDPRAKVIVQQIADCQTRVAMETLMATYAAQLAFQLRELMIQLQPFIDWYTREIIPARLALKAKLEREEWRA